MLIEEQLEGLDRGKTNTSFQHGLYPKASFRSNVIVLKVGTNIPSIAGMTGRLSRGPPLCRVQHGVLHRDVSIDESLALFLQTSPTDVS